MTPRLWTAALLACGLSAAAAPAAPVDPLTEFGARISSYMTLHGRFEEPLPTIGADRGGRSDALARRYLASAIRTARRHARQGDMFPPAVAAMFRERLAGVLSPDELLLMPGLPGEGSGPPDVQINEPFAEEWFTDLPPRAEHALPPLPVGLVYRLVGADLVLWDAHAELVVDVLPDAIR
jgi:hypothetical protein